MLGSIVEWVLASGRCLLRSWGNRRKLQVRIHRAAFEGGGPECYFVNVTNLSKTREVEITHVWFATNPEVHILEPRRPLPKRLRPDGSWETWISVTELPIQCDEQVARLGRVRMSNGAVMGSKKRREVPSRGFVPGEDP